MMLFVTSVLTQAQGKSAELGLMAMLLRRHNRRCLWRLPEQTIRDARVACRVAGNSRSGEFSRGEGVDAAEQAEEMD